MPPASSKALRWSIIVFVLSPAVLVFAAIWAALAHEWIGLVVALVMLCTYGVLKSAQLRIILRELARRRSGRSSAGSGKATPPGGE
jgi:hypothetical protein